MDVSGQDEFIQEIAHNLERWGLTVPGIAFLEANKPFAFLGSQALLFLQPLLNGLVRPAVSEQYIRFLQDRDGIERLIQKLELGANQAAQEDEPCR